MTLTVRPRGPLSFPCGKLTTSAALLGAASIDVLVGVGGASVGWAARVLAAVAVAVVVDDVARSARPSAV